MNKISGVRGAVAKSIGAVAGSLVALALTLPPSTDQVEAASTVDHSAAQSLPECPFSANKSGTVPDVDPIAGIPEFHDCQQFIAPTGAKYTALFAIYALPYQDLVWDSVVSSPSTAYLAGVIRSFPGMYAGVLQSGTYAPLGIAAGINCLYLYQTTSQGGGLEPAAKLVNNPSNDCPNLVAATLAGPGVTSLTVKRITVAGHTKIDYPGVARWEWDLRKRQHYIGIMCDAWCEIGPPGFTSASGYQSSEISSVGKRVVEIKGWFDEQRLALPGGAGGGLTPSSIRGTVFPDSALDRYVLTDFVIGRWMPVAAVAFPADNPFYKNTLNFRNRPAGSPVQVSNLNRVELCKGTRNQCRVPANIPCKWKATALDATPDTLWWASITSTGRNRLAPQPLQTVRAFRCVVRRDHSNLSLHIPGTARWRWHTADETLWMRCAQGCCEVDQ